MFHRSTTTSVGHSHAFNVFYVEYIGYRYSVCTMYKQSKTSKINCTVCPLDFEGPASRAEPVTGEAHTGEYTDL